VLGAVVDLSEDAFFTCDADGRVDGWSRAAERLFGRAATDVLGVRCSTLFPGEMLPVVDLVGVACHNGEPTDRVEAEVVRPDGLPVPVLISARPVSTPDGEVVGSVVAVRDITEQRLAQATLAEVEARLVEGEAFAHVGSWLWDLRTGAVQWSAELHRIHGVDPLDFDGTFDAHLAVIHPEDRVAVRGALEAAVSAGRRYEGEYRIVLPHREVRWLHVVAVPVIGSDGRPVGLRGVGRDITSVVVSRDP
jgi:PAS domain S-box-containing protein